MMNIISDILTQIVNASKNIDNAVNGSATVVDERNDEKCVKYHSDGWKHDGFDYMDNSSDIIVYWKKSDQRKAVILTPLEQRRWIVFMNKEIKAGRV